MEVKRGRSAVTSAKICDICSRINIESLSSPDGCPHVSKKLSSKSCPLCKDIFDFVDKEMEDTPVRIKLSQELSSMGSVTLYLSAELGEKSVRSFAPVITEEGQIFADCHGIGLAKVPVGDPATVRYGVPTFRTVTSSGSQETISIANGWLKHCVDNHDCHKSLFRPRKKENQRREYSDIVDERSIIYPIRLLDLQSFEKDCSDVRLIEKPVPGSVYATLSHCWGANPDTRYQATKSTFQDLKDRIRYTELPATYCHAISVCRLLRIRYLWIDSLCIIQDSKEDWASQAAIMAYVYSNSHLTISADWSSNPEGGCYKIINGPQGINTEKASCIMNILSNGERSSLYFPRYYDPTHQDLDYTQLAGRAWAYQERFLSRRNLHFTQNQLFWECRRGFAGEDMVPRSPGSLRPAYLLQMRAWDNIESRLHVWCFWVITHYSSAKITFPTDRLPAVSALANLFADDLCSPYLAGLWLEGLWYTLSWYRHDRESIERPKEYIAPSWSWVSINAGVNWLIQLPGYSIKKRVEIRDAVVEHVGDPFGQVSHGWVRVTGPFVETVSLSKTGQTAFLDDIYPDYPRETPPLAVHCLLLGERTSSWTENYFLLLVISSKDPNVYERYGMGSKRSDISSEQWQEKTITII
jgi:hypothetical protein